MERILTVNFKVEDVEVLKNAANLLLDLDDANKTKGNAKLKVDGIETELLVRLLESFKATATSVENGLDYSTFSEVAEVNEA